MIKTRHGRRLYTLLLIKGREIKAPVKDPLEG